MKQTVFYTQLLVAILARGRFLGCFLLLWVASLGASPAQTLDPSFYIPEIYGEGNVVDAAQMPNGQLVAAGSFTRINGQTSSGLARFDAAGVADQTFRQNVSGATISAKKLVPMANGQLLVQGDYASGSAQRSLLFRLNADGTLDPTLNLALPNAGTLPRIDQAIVQPDGRILITGLYLTNGNNSERNLFRVLSDGSRDPSFNATLATTSQAGSMLLRPDGKIIVRGEFDRIIAGNRGLIRLNSDGSPDTGFQAAINITGQQRIDCIALDANDALLVGGIFSSAGTSPAPSLYRLLSNGALDPSFTAPASLLGRYCNQLEVLPNGQIMVLAAVYSATGTTYPFSNQLVKLQADGTVDAAFQPGSGPDSSLSGVRALANNNFLTWGFLNNYAGQRRTLALVQPAGGLDAGFAPLLQKPATIQKIVRQADGKLLIAGSFNMIDGHLTDRLARLFATGQPDPTFAWRQPNSATWSLAALAVQADGQVLLADNMTSTFVRLTTSGTVDPSFTPALTVTPSAPNRIRLLAEQANGQILVGGTFVDAAGKANLTRLTASGSVEPTFTPSATQPGINYGAVQANGSLICLVAAPAPAYQTIVRLLPSGAPDLTFAYTPTNVRDDYMQRIAQVPGTGDYIVGGVASNATQVLTRISASGTPVAGFSTPFQPLIDPIVPQSGLNAVAVQNDGKILVGGSLRQSYPYTSPATPFARLGANGQPDPGFNAAVIANPVTSSSNSIYGLYSVSDILVQPDGAIVVGGYFLQAAGQPVTGLVRLLPAGLLPLRAGKEDGRRIQAWPVPAHDVLHLQLEAAASPQRVTLLDGLGKAVIAEPATNAELTLNTAALARGLYVLRVDYASGPVTRRIVLE